jgi:hypothetical protein
MRAPSPTLPPEIQINAHIPGNSIMSCPARCSLITGARILRLLHLPSGLALLGIAHRSCYSWVLFPGARYCGPMVHRRSLRYRLGCLQISNIAASGFCTGTLHFRLCGYGAVGMQQRHACFWRPAAASTQHPHHHSQAALGRLPPRSSAPTTPTGTHQRTCSVACPSASCSSKACASTPLSSHYSAPTPSSRPSVSHCSPAL